jgi:hypothetical protein
MKYKACNPVPLLVIVIFLGSCPNMVDLIPYEPQEVYYGISIVNSEHGTVRAIPDRARRGTEIQLLINPEPGYVLQDGVLVLNDNSVSTTSFDMPARNTLITAVFVKDMADNNSTVSIGPLENGYIRAVPLYGTPGTEISLFVNAGTGYGLKEGSLKANGTVISGPPYRFSLGIENVTVTAEFTSQSSGDLVMAGKKALSTGNYNGAVDYFEAAYLKDNNNSEAILYSSLGRMVSIAVDTDVRQLIKSRLGLSVYPGNLNDLFTVERWMRLYYLDKTGAEGVYRPQMSSPAGFQNHSLWQTNLTGTGQPTLQVYEILTWLEFHNRNSSGWNDLLDDSLRYIFGDAFEAAADRAERLGNERIILDTPEIIKALFLTDYVSPGESIGKEELNAVFGALRVVKAALEWIASYDWETDTLPFPWDLKQPFNTIMSETLLRLEERMYLRDINELDQVLPFKNFFLKDRRNGRMERSRADFRKALKSLTYAWDYYADDSNTVPTALKAKANAHRWLGEGLAQLGSTLGSGGTFYFPKQLPQDGMWPSSASADYGVNMDKIFISGLLALEKLIVTEQGGKAPVFYGLANETAANGVAITSKGQFAQYSVVNIAFNAKTLNQVFEKGFKEYQDTVWLHTVFSGAFFNRQNGEKFYEFYHKR